MAFEGLTEKINNTFKKLRGKGRLKESDVKEAMREIRLALLEADVSYKVVKDFVKKVTERAVGEAVLESLLPAQQIVKIVNEELIALMESHSNFELHVIKPKKHITGSKKTYEGMNDAFMKDYISIQENAKSLMEEYEEGKRLAKKDGRSVYPTMKKWFLDQFSSEEEPFDMKEVSARVKAVLRRYSGHDTDDSEVIKFDNLEISLQKYELKLAGKAVDIPPKELELLYFLASNYNRVFTRDQLLDKVWGFEYLGDSRTVDVHVKRLREKLEGVEGNWMLKTVWGVGYKFEVKE